MKAFARLYADLDASGSTSHKVGSMVRYLREAPPADAAWATYFLAGGKPRQIVPARLLREAAREVSGLPEWLVDESYSSVGDLAETIAHLLPEGQACESLGLSQWMEERLLPLRGAPAEVGIEALKTWWSQLDWNGRFALNKLITGGFRVGVSKQLVVRALAEVAGLEATLIAQRMIGYTDARRMPDAQRYLALIEPVVEGVAVLATGGQPYPFFLAHPLQGEVASLGAVQDWQVEWKWDGIRAQLVMRGEQVWLWSRGEELITERFPEIERAARQLVEGLGLVRPALDGPLRDGLVLDGEVLAWDVARSRPLPLRNGAPSLSACWVGQRARALRYASLTRLSHPPYWSLPPHRRPQPAIVCRPGFCVCRRCSPRLTGPNSPPCASPRANAALKASCSSAGPRCMASVAPELRASTGGSGRSSLTASMRCWSMRSAAMADARAFIPTTPLRCGVAPQARAPSRQRCCPLPRPIPA
jgi:DNA ligase-1